MTADVKLLTIEGIEKYRSQMHHDLDEHCSALEIDALCDLALRGLATPPYVRGEGLQAAINETYAHAKPAADCNQSDSVMPRERVEAMLRAYVGEPQQGSTSLLCDCKHGGFRKGTCGDCPHTSSSISGSR